MWGKKENLNSMSMSGRTRRRYLQMIRPVKSIVQASGNSQQQDGSGSSVDDFRNAVLCDVYSPDKEAVVQQANLDASDVGSEVSDVSDSTNASLSLSSDQSLSDNDDVSCISNTEATDGFGDMCIGEDEAPVYDSDAPHDDVTYLQTPLSPGIDTTRGDVLLMCLAHGLRYKLPWAAIVDNLKIINSIFGREVVRATKSFFDQYMSARKGKVSYHLCCYYCQRYLGLKDNFTEPSTTCTCGKMTKVNQCKSFFITLSLGDQVKEFLQDTDFVDALQHRFKRRKKDEQALEDIYDGELYSNLSAPGGILSHWYNMSYIFHTDRYPVGSKSGKQTCWPIYVQINELPHNLRSKYMILAALYVGKKDPNMQIFLQPFVKEANDLLTFGITWNLNGKKVNSKVIPLCVCVDTLARSKILNTTTFFGSYSCSLCFQDPEMTQSGLRYPISADAMIERKHEDMLMDARQAVANRTFVRNKLKRHVRGLKGPSPLQNLLYFDLVKGVQPDIMYSIMLGIGKHHVTVLYESPGHPFFIGAEATILAIKKRLLSIKPPSLLPRAPSDFLSFCSWKPNEWLAWILFYAVPCLINIVPEKYVTHFGLLSAALHIVLSKSISGKDLDVAYVLVLRYVFLFQQYFGMEEMVINIHLLLHMRKNLKLLGPAWTNIAFSSEGANKSLLELKKGSYSISKEIVQKYMTFKALPQLCDKYAKTERTVEFCENISGRPLLKSFISKESLLPEKGKYINLTLEETKCLSQKAFVRHKDAFTHEILIHAGVRYSVESYSQTSNRDDSYISVSGDRKARIQMIVKLNQDDTHFIVLMVKELLLDHHPLFDDEFGRHYPIRRIIGEGDLFAIIPEDISGQCVAMYLESGNFIADVPYGCCGDS